MPYYIPPKVDYGVYGDLTIIYPKPYSIYLSGARTVGKGLSDLGAMLDFCDTGFSQPWGALVDMRIMSVSCFCRELS